MGEQVLEIVTEKVADVVVGLVEATIAILVDVVVK